MPNIGLSQYRNASERSIDNPWTIASVVVGSAIALLALYLGPFLVGEYIAALDVSDSRAGLIMSAEMIGFTLGSAILFFFLAKSWRRIVISALLLMILGNVISMLVDELLAFVISRFVAGLGAGILMTMTIQVIALMRSPDRIYGLWTVVQLAFGAAGMIIFPVVIASHGIKAVFLIWAILAAILFVSVQFYPHGRRSGGPRNTGSTTVNTFVLGLLCLGGVFVYYCGQAGVWVYMERVGASWKLSPEMVRNTLFISLIAGMLGSGLAVLLDSRFGRSIPLSVSLIISGISIFLMIQLSGASFFVLAACLFNFGWYLFLPYVSAVIASIDDSGRLLTGLAVTFPAGLAAGPAIAALLLNHYDSLTPVLFFGLISVPIGLALILPASRLRSI